MKGSLKTFSLILASTLVAGCGAPKQSAMINVDYECDDSICEVLVDIQNPGPDSFRVEYHFSAFTSGSTLVGELEESFEVPGNYSATLSRQVPVTAKPMAFGSGSTIQRL